MKWLLLPFALIFGFIVRVRNYMYDQNFLRSKSFNLPVIVVGNLTVGGTGKTPHVEYLIDQLKDRYKITTLSRGYKRKTKGFVEASPQSNANQIGDEPLQIKLKYPDIQVVVDENRTHAIEFLISQSSKPDVIILDDAFQHRKVKGGLNIVLIDYNRPIYNDYYLPMGRLRETKSALNRAQIIIITKCPEEITIAEQQQITKKLDLKYSQKVYFTSMKYGNLYPLFEKKDYIVPNVNQLSEAIVFTGIAQPKPFIDYLEIQGLKIHEFIFPDHYSFNNQDINKILDAYKSLNNSSAIIICTEKDAARLRSDQFKEILTGIPVYYLPIKVGFLNNNQSTFDDQLKKFINNTLN